MHRSSPPSLPSSLAPSFRHLTTNFLVATFYVLIHAILLFVHVVTLFVAVNSADQALLTLLISNNFAEMKTSVFKRYGGREGGREGSSSCGCCHRRLKSAFLPPLPPSLPRFDPKLLFQLTCSDMVERFKLLLFLVLITLLNFGQHAKEEGGVGVIYGKEGGREGGRAKVRRRKGKRRGLTDVVFF